MTVDHREKLFSEFKASHERYENVRQKIKEHGELLEQLHKEGNDCERELNFLKRVVHLNIVDDMDPVLAKFTVSEEIKQEPYQYGKSPGLYSTISIAEDRPQRRGKFKRMFKAIMEIYNERD
jgi:hypothetical protein